MKAFLSKMFEALWQHPQIMAASFVGGLVIGCIWILVTRPETVRLVMFGG